MPKTPRAAGPSDRDGTYPGAASAPQDWRALLEPLTRHSTAALAEEPAALGVGFDLRAQPFEKSRFSWAGDDEATLEHIRAGKPLALAIRPLKAGKRGRWVKSGLSWRTFEYRIHQDAFVREHAEALTRIFAIAQAHRSHTAGPVDQLWLNDLPSPLLWEMLTRAEAAGVALVGQGTVSGVEIGESARIHLDATLATDGAPGSGGLRITPAASIDGQPAELLRMIGTAAVVDIRPEADDALHLRLAPTEQPVPRALAKLVGLPEPLAIPAADADAFWRSTYPALQQTVQLTSSDDSVELPEIEAPTLIVQAAYAPKERLTLTWSWQYHDPERTLPLDLSSHRDHARARLERRDVAHEDEVLATVRTLWPTVGGDTGTELLSDVDTAVFTTEVLDELGRLPHVEVHITGTRHRYRELDGAPHVRITQTPSERNDWFDLGFEITIDGEKVAFSSVFVALAQGKSKLLLPNRSDYVSLEDPAFDELRRLILEGEALAEWTPEHQQVSRYQVDFWDEITEAADEARAAEEWASTVGRLRGLEQIPQPPLPTGLAAQLRPYQRAGFAWLAFLHEHRLGGILADDMGLGKTLQTLALVVRARELAPDAPPFLVVAPSSVLSVWEEEARRFAPALDVRVADRTRRARGTGLDADGADVVVTSYTLLRIDEREYTEKDWSGLVLDEAQFVKNRRAKVHQAAAQIRAPFRLAITGTPMENSLEDLWSLLALTASGVFPSPVAFRTEYVKPIESGEAPERMEQLRRRIRPFMLRRTKELVAADLPAKQEQVLTVRLEPEHRELYDIVLQRERKKVLGLVDDMDRFRMIVFRSLTLLRMLALDPALIDDGAYENVPGSKNSVLLDHLREVVADGHRVLVFSQFTSYLRRIEQRLREDGLETVYLDGSTRQRGRVIEQWRAGDAPVFLISLKAGGFGLTLTEADYVFLLDPWWNPASESQAIDRAHRIGQDKQVMVYRMVAEDTIEEKVLALQRKKAALFTALTDNGSAFSEAITADDVRELLGE